MWTHKQIIGVDEGGGLPEYNLVNLTGLGLNLKFSQIIGYGGTEAKSTN